MFHVKRENILALATGKTFPEDANQSTFKAAGGIFFFSSLSVPRETQIDEGAFCFCI